MSASILIYDIPEVVKPRLPHRLTPAGFLRPVAVRIQGSAWVIQERDLRAVAAQLSEWRSLGITWNTVRFHEDEGETLAMLVITNIRSQVREKIDNAREAVAAECASLELGSVESEKRFRTRRNVIIRESRRMIAEVRQAAGRFGIQAEHLDGGAGWGVMVDSLDARMKRLCDSFATAVRKVRAKNGSGDAAARSAALGEIPPDVFADYCDENDVPHSIRDAFGL